MPTTTPTLTAEPGADRLRIADDAAFDGLLTPDALTFLTRLHGAFSHRRHTLLLSRRPDDAAHPATAASTATTRPVWSIAAPGVAMAPRGWEVDETHVSFTDRSGRSQPASASLVDVGLYLFHSGATLADNNRSPRVLLPELENHVEARLWDDVFTFSENALRLHHGTIRAVVVTGTGASALELQKILDELHDHFEG